jgi:hypothetical protein
MLARLYSQAEALGTPNVLSQEQMADVLAKYEHRRTQALEAITPAYT